MYGGEKGLGPASVNTGTHERHSVEASVPATLTGFLNVDAVFTFYECGIRTPPLHSTATASGSAGRLIDRKRSAGP